MANDPDVKLTVTADAKQVKGELETNVAAPFDQLATKTTEFGDSTAEAFDKVTEGAQQVGGLKFGESFAGQAATAEISLAQFVTTAGAALAALTALRAAKEGVVDTIGEVGRAAGVSAEGVERLQTFIRDIPTDPIEALTVWLGKVKVAVENYVSAEEKATYAAALHIPKLQAEKMSVDELEKAYNKLIGKIRQRQAEIEGLVGGSAQDVQRQADNVLEAIRRIEAKGAVSAEAAENIKSLLQGAIDVALTANEQVPASLQQAADKYGVLSSSMEETARKADETAKRSAAAAKREQEAAEASAAKQEERAAREVAASEQRAAAAEAEAKRKIEAIQTEIAAAEERVAAAQAAYEAEVAKNEQTEQGDKELEQLRAKGVLTAEEQARLEELTRANLSNAAAIEKRRQAGEAQRREDEAWIQVEEERLRLEEKQSEWLTESLAQSDARRQASYDETEAAKYRTEGARDLFAAEKALADELVKQGKATREQADAHLAASEAAHNSALAASELTEAAKPAAQALGEVGEKGKSASDGMKATAEDAKAVTEQLREMRDLIVEINSLLPAMRLGGIAEGL